MLLNDRYRLADLVPLVPVTLGGFDLLQLLRVPGNCVVIVPDGVACGLTGCQPTVEGIDLLLYLGKLLVADRLCSYRLKLGHATRDLRRISIRYLLASSCFLLHDRRQLLGSVRHLFVDSLVATLLFKLSTLQLLLALIAELYVTEPVLQLLGYRTVSLLVCIELPAETLGLRYATDDRFKLRL